MDIDGSFGPAMRDAVKKFQSDNTPYGQWYGMNGQPWCAMFVSWCAFQAGTLGKLVPKFAYCPSGKSHYVMKLSYRSRTSGYKPKRGDIVFFWDGSVISHTGVVVGRSGNTVTTIEGNASRMVKKNSYSLNNTFIDGYGNTNMLPTPGDPDYTPDKPDNPDQVAANKADLERGLLAVLIVVGSAAFAKVTSTLNIGKIFLGTARYIMQKI